MIGRFRALKSDIQAELEVIGRIFAALPAPDADLTDVAEVIVTGY